MFTYNLFFKIGSKKSLAQSEDAIIDLALKLMNCPDVEIEVEFSGDKI